MTSVDDAVTVRDLREFLADRDDDQPVLVEFTGVHDCLAPAGMETVPLAEGGEGVMLDGDVQ